MPKHSPQNCQASISLPVCNSSVSPQKFEKEVKMAETPSSGLLSMLNTNPNEADFDRTAVDRAAVVPDQSIPESNTLQFRSRAQQDFSIGPSTRISRPEIQKPLPNSPRNASSPSQGFIPAPLSHDLVINSGPSFQTQPTPPSQSQDQVLSREGPAQPLVVEEGSIPPPTRQVRKSNLILPVVKRLDWIDGMRGLAEMVIFLHHFGTFSSR